MKSKFYLLAVIFFLIFQFFPHALKAEPVDLYDQGLDYYYGIGVKQDYQKAMQCFQAEGSYGSLFVILMYINGQGVKVDLDKVQKLLDSTSEDELGASPEEIKRAIEERRNNPGKTFQPLTCDDVAETTPEINQCEGIKMDIAKNRYKSEIEEAQKYMGPGEVNVLAVVEEKFETYEKNDSERVLDNSDGSMRTLYELGQSEELMENHGARIEMWLIQRRLKLFRADDFEKADRDLNVAYNHMMGESYDIRKHSMESENSQDSKDRASVAITAEKAWIDYRDAWVNLLKLYRPKGNLSDADIENSVKTQLSLDRINELKEDD